MNQADYRPLHPVSQMTTYELAEYRRSLEHALSPGALSPLHASREELQKRLDGVLAEEADRCEARRAST